MLTPILEKARKRLALRIAQAIEAEFQFPLSSNWDSSKAAAVVELMLPLTAVEADAEMDAMDKPSKRRKPAQPSHFTRLRQAMNLPEGATIGDVLEQAIWKIQAAEEPDES